MRQHISSLCRFSNRKLPSDKSPSIYEKLYEALWGDTLELRKKSSVMVGILGIILPLLITVYLNNKEVLNFDSDLFTIFFGTYLLVFVQYFGLFIFLYNVPKYGIDWGNMNLDDKNIRPLPHTSRQSVSININWIEFLKEQKTTYTFCQFFSFILDITIISTVTILALYFRTYVIAGNPFSLCALLLAFSLAISSCIVGAILLIGYLISHDKFMGKFNTCH